MNLKTPSRTDPIAPSQSHIGRRQLLYGLGVAIGLPFLVSLRPKARFAASTLPVSSPGRPRQSDGKRRAEWD